MLKFCCAVLAQHGIELGQVRYNTRDPRTKSRREDLTALTRRWIAERYERDFAVLGFPVIDDDSNSESWQRDELERAVRREANAQEKRLYSWQFIDAKKAECTILGKRKRCF